MAEVMAPTYVVRPDPATGALQLARYDGYWGPKAPWDRVIFRIVTSGSREPVLRR